MIRKNQQPVQFLPVEKITILYIAVTSLIMCFIRNDFQHLESVLIHRAFIVATILFLVYLNTLFPSNVIKSLRVILIGALIVYWYPETFDFNRNFQNHDYLLAHWDQRMFGFQPAFIFAQLFTGRWIEELMYMGYFFFYMLIIGSVLFIYFKNRPHFEYFLFTVLFSFFVYYLIYILFPTAGPQFYYSAIGPADVKTGLFPHIGCYFNYNSVSSDVNSVHGFFPLLVERIQCFGERPTAAFPSSHVGISTLILLLLFKDRQYRYFLVLFPVYLILVLATVYIRAHYVVDVLSGFFSAIVLFFISPYVYSIFVKPTSLLKIK